LKGRIINISSTMGKTGSAMGTAYSASKAAVIGFSQALAKELAASDIRVNTVCPGAMDTDMLRKDTLGVLAGIYNTTEEALLKSTANAIPIKRLVTPDEVARVVLFLARDDVDFLAGQVLNVCGGHELH
jgi:NAD(P)-dependent dehydrogenase (short-subunit alcohol dehydrogenase family)